jgi:hypothetical protein
MRPPGRHLVETLVGVDGQSIGSPFLVGPSATNPVRIERTVAVPDADGHAIDLT